MAKEGNGAPLARVKAIFKSFEGSIHLQAELKQCMAVNRDGWKFPLRTRRYGKLGCRHDVASLVFLVIGLPYKQGRIAASVIITEDTPNRFTVRFAKVEKGGEACDKRHKLAPKTSYLAKPQAAAACGLAPNHDPERF